MKDSESVLGSFRNAPSEKDSIFNIFEVQSDLTQIDNILISHLLDPQDWNQGDLVKETWRETATSQAPVNELFSLRVGIGVFPAFPG